MSAYSKQYQLEPNEVLLRAEEFFGAEGQGLKLIERNACCLSFLNTQFG